MTRVEIQAIRDGWAERWAILAGKTEAELAADWKRTLENKMASFRKNHPERWNEVTRKHQARAAIEEEEARR